MQSNPPLKSTNPLAKIHAREADTATDRNQTAGAEAGSPVSWLSRNREQNPTAGTDNFEIRKQQMLKDIGNGYRITTDAAHFLTAKPKADRSRIQALLEQNDLNDKLTPQQRIHWLQKRKQKREIDTNMTEPSNDEPGFIVTEEELQKELKEMVKE